MIQARGSNNMNAKMKYADQWEKSSEYFHSNGEYQWMVDNIRKYEVVLEVGCGSGYGTLELLRNRHKVISIENNEYCLEQAKNKIENEGFIVNTDMTEFNNSDVVLINSDITDASILDQFRNCKIGVVICWNVGSYWSEEMATRYLSKLLSYGLTLEQIKENPESSYAELVIWSTLSTAKKLKASTQIIERVGRKLIKEDRDYYRLLRKDFAYKNVKFNQKMTKALSKGGRMLSVQGNPQNVDELDIYLTSIMFK